MSMQGDRALEATRIEDVASRYASAGTWDRFHIRQRLLRCPHEPILPYLPHHGRLLDIGCGFGLLGWYLRAQRPSVEYFGTDIDAHKVSLAREAFAENASTASHFYLGDVRDWRERPETFHVVTIFDVLLLMPTELQRAIFDFSCDVLDSAPGSRILLKILPRLSGLPRYRTWLQENIMVNVLKKTASSGALQTSQDPAMFERWGRERGLSCREIPMQTHPASVLLVLQHDADA
jgi:SAM-dependent methyltransferase